MHSEQKTLLIISSILIAYLALSLSFFLVFIDHGFYDKSFSRYGAYDKLGVEGVRNTIDDLIHYLTQDFPGSETLSGLAIFTQKEMSHLSDVHTLFIWAKYLSIASAIGILVIALRFRAKGMLVKMGEKMALYGAIGASIALAAIFLLGLNFERLFTGFHHIFFPQGNWQFPADSLLITLFPEQFFQDFFMKMLFHALIITIILYFLGTSSKIMGHNAGKK
jgi:integral membrane protein (TIGR01906 family)